MTTKTKDVETTEQTSLALAPEIPPDLRMMELRIDSLTYKESPKPNAALRASVETWGIMQPILVHEDGANFVVVDGNRRVLAAKDHFMIVQCTVTTNLGYLKHVATMMLNNTREKNIIAEMEAIDALLAQGATVEQIAKATGTATNTVKKRLKLQTINPEIRKLAEDGKIASGVLEQITKLSKTEQEMLVQGIEERDPDENHRSAISAEDVKTVRSAKAQQAALSIDPSLFQDPKGPDGEFDNVKMATTMYVNAMIAEGETVANVVALVKAAWKQFAGQKRTG